MRILFIIPNHCFPPHDGGQIRTVLLATALARHGELTVLNLDGTETGKLSPSSGDVEYRFGKAYRWIDLPFGGRALFWNRPFLSLSRRRFPKNLDVIPWFKALLRGIPMAFWPKDRATMWTWDHIWKLKPDMVVTATTDLAAFAVFAPSQYRIASTENFESALSLDHACFSPDDKPSSISRALKVRTIERELLYRADQTWFTSGVDTDLHQRAAQGHLNAFTIPNVAMPCSFLECIGPGETGTGLFVGSLWWQPNQSAIKELIDVSKSLEAMGVPHRIRIAGRGAPPSLQAAMATCRGLEPLGFVEDLPALLGRSGIVMIPMAYGGGTKLKTVEAMAAGKPMLLSPKAAEGIQGLQDGVHAVIRPLGAPFVEAAAEMLTHPERYLEMGRNAQHLARESYSQDALHVSLDHAFEALGITAPGSSPGTPAAPACNTENPLQSLTGPPYTIKGEQG